MRIDFVITELFVGGAEKCLTDLVLGLAKRGDQVRVFSIGQLPTGPQAGLVKRLQDARVPIESGESDSFLDLPKAVRRLRNWLHQSPAEVLQSFLFHANVITSLAIPSKTKSKFIGGLRVAQPSRFRNLVERRAISTMDHLVCVSEATGRFASKALKCPTEKWTVIPNSIDVDRWQDASAHDWSKLNWPSNSIVTLFVGRLHPQKNLESLQRNIDAIAPINSDRRLLLIGDGPLGPSLRSWTDEIGHERVQCLPWQSDVRPFMRASRMLVLPSHYEGMPNVVMEAMASGLPVVTSRVEGSEELLGDTQEAQSFSVGDEASMVRLISHFADNAPVAHQIGLENQNRMRDHFSIETMVDRYRELYQSKLSQGNQGR
jgi:glycosyltransferase involved in cell wall biosynthesis